MRRLIAGLLLAAGATPAVADIVPPIMPVYAVNVGPGEVTVRIPAKTCTPRKSELTAAVAKTERGAMMLIARKRPNEVPECRANLGPANISWTLEELGLKPGEAFSLANPLVSDPSP